MSAFPKTGQFQTGQFSEVRGPLSARSGRSRLSVACPISRLFCHSLIPINTFRINKNNHQNTDCGTSKELQSIELPVSNPPTNSLNEALTPGRIRGQTQAFLMLLKVLDHPLNPSRSIASGGKSPCSTCRSTVSPSRAKTVIFVAYCRQSVSFISSGDFLIISRKFRSCALVSNADAVAIPIA
jgi:hypothetical protein